MVGYGQENNSSVVKNQKIQQGIYKIVKKPQANQPKRYGSKTCFKNLGFHQNWGPVVGQAKNRTRSENKENLTRNSPDHQQNKKQHNQNATGRKHASKSMGGIATRSWTSEKMNP